MEAIHWLGDAACHEQSLVGGKAANLSRFASAHTVPPGFAIPALSPRMTSLSSELTAAISDAYHALAERRGSPEVPVAVRSSALDEDGASASFAGQHDTYLNVRGCNTLLDAVLRCAQSAASPEAVAYRAQHGLSNDDVRIAVLVQELVLADVAAVAFSCNPISGDRDEIMINASWGLGESIVAGMVTPDTFVVSKHGPSLIWSEIATKERMTVLTPAGTQDSHVPADLRDQPSIDERQVLEIARLACALEATSGHPVDVECAIAQDVLHLLQCRPITTLG